MQKSTPGWKALLAIFSLLLTILIWQRGLQESFDRPSVSPKLALNQREMAVLAAPSLPDSLRPVLVGEDPNLELKKTLLQVDGDKIDDRGRLLLAALEVSDEKRRSLLQNNLQDQTFEKLRTNLLKDFDSKGGSQVVIENLELVKNDPLLYRLSCFSIGGDPEICIDSKVSQINALRLLSSQLIPLLATLLGIFLLVWQAWIYFRKKTLPWPEVAALPLSMIDMVILIAGGFVVLGELLSPLISIPFGDLLTREVASPLKEAIKVFLGYVAMTIPPLFILRKQIISLKGIVLSGDWFQWGFGSFPKSLFDAFKAWLMVMPFVLFVSWLTTLFFGDPGGSNPLLEMVLSSRNFLALTVLFITTVFMAPFFEEFIFRGTLLPVLVKGQGRVIGIFISALVFALAHLSVGETPPLFVLGIGLALLRLSSGRLLPCVIMHSLWNGVTFANLLILSG